MDTCSKAEFANFGDAVAHMNSVIVTAYMGKVNPSIHRGGSHNVLTQIEELLAIGGH